MTPLFSWKNSVTPQLFHGPPIGKKMIAPKLMEGRDMKYPLTKILVFKRRKTDIFVQEMCTYMYDLLLGKWYFASYAVSGSCVFKSQLLLKKKIRQNKTKPCITESINNPHKCTTLSWCALFVSKWYSWLDWSCAISRVLCLCQVLAASRFLVLSEFFFFEW